MNTSSGINEDLLYYDLGDLSHTDILGPRSFPLSVIEQANGPDFAFVGWKDLRRPTNSTKSRWRRRRCVNSR